MIKLAISIVLMAVVLIGGFLLMSGGDSDTKVDTGSVIEVDPSQSEGSQDVAETKEFTLTGENFKFVMGGKDNPDIIVKQGDKVKITFTSTGGFHDWVLDEFNAATEKVRDTDGKSTTVEFVADKKGTFEYYCSVGSHRANGMKGNLIVE